MKKIAIEDISINDRRYAVSYPPVDPSLVPSIEKVGIVEPVIVSGKPPYLVVTGFRRLDAALSLHWTEVPCIVEDMDEQTALLCAIHGNLQRGLNIVEKAHAIERMLYFGFSMDQVFETMSFLGLQPHEKPLATLLALANCEDTLKSFVVDHKVSLRSIDHLLTFDPSQRAALISILSRLRLTESYLREILQLLALLKVKTGIIPFESLSLHEGTEDLRRHLKDLVNPKLTQLREEFAAHRSACSLPPGMDIRVDPFFEKEYIDISIRIRTPEDLKRAIQKLEELQDDSHVRSMLGLTKS
jgi:ParB family transcriptional regulator, chromosome partitioning protein